MSKTVLLITHEETTASDYGYVADYLRELGHTVIHHDVLRATPGFDGFLDADTNFPSLDGIDSVIIFGSFTHAYNPTTREWVEKEIDFIRSVCERGTPYLGICFGAQLLAEVLGGRTIKADRMEVGMITVDATAACPTAPGPWFSWHNDIVELPDDVEVLARTDIAPQVFKAGNSLGVQFHPEVTTELMNEWLRVGGDELTGNYTAEEFKKEWEAKGKYAQAHGRELIDWFLTVEPVVINQS
jgi:GMP synthase (glutamine-hydrolysing)